MPKVIAFDVNETLLDLSVLDEPFQRLLGSAELRPRWFAQMLQLAFVGGLTGRYVDFTSAQRAALWLIAQQAGRSVTDREIDEVVAQMSHLPPHPEVRDALARLRAGGLAVAALTNSTGEVADAQLRHAGLSELFDAAISADSVRALKPLPQPYHAVADRFEVPIEEVRLVAAHGWDISGALAAGARAAFVARAGAQLNPLAPPPDIVGSDVSEVVDEILLRDA